MGKAFLSASCEPSMEPLSTTITSRLCVLDDAYAAATARFVSAFVLYDTMIIETSVGMFPFFPKRGLHTLLEKARSSKPVLEFPRPFSNLFGRNTTNNTHCGNIFCHYRACRNYRAFADFDSWQNDRARTNKDIVSNIYGFFDWAKIIGAKIVFRVKKHDARSNVYVIPNG